MIYTFTGKNTHLLSEELQRITAAFLKEHGDMALERIDASELAADEIISRVCNLPFLAERKLVIVRSAEQNQPLLESIETLTERVPDSVDVYLVGQFDKRKSSFKDLKKLTQLKEFSDVNERDLPAWIVAYTKEQGGSISQSDARYLMERVGAKQQLLAREIEKLLIVDAAIARSSIQTLTEDSVEESIFALLDEVFSGKSSAALKRYRQQRSQQIDPHYIIAMLTWQLQQLALAVFAPDSDKQTLVQAGMSSYAAGKMQRLANSTTKADVRRYITLLSDVDMQIKNSAGVDADAALETYILEITSKNL